MTPASPSRIAPSSSRSEARSFTRSAAVVASSVRARSRVTLAIAASISSALRGGANGGANEAPYSRSRGPTCSSTSVVFLGGERGIRTHGTLAGTPDFESLSLRQEFQLDRAKVAAGVRARLFALARRSKWPTPRASGKRGGPLVSPVSIERTMRDGGTFRTPRFSARSCSRPPRGLAHCRLRDRCQWPRARSGRRRSGARHVRRGKPRRRCRARRRCSG
jgi:hypothetical protein